MKEMDKLEQFINDNRDHFEDLKPSNKSWEKISQHLDQNVDQEKSPGGLWVLKRVAAAVIIVFAMYGAYNVVIRVAQKNTLAKEQKQSNPALKEYNEAEAFYTSQVQYKIAQLEQISKDHPEIIVEVKEEFDLLNDDMKKLKDDFNEGVAQQEIIEAMVQNYRIKLQILENMLQQIFQQQTDKNSNDEKHTIKI